MGSKPCLNSCGEWCFLSFEGKKSILEANFEGPLGLQAQAGSIFLDPHARCEHFEYLWLKKDSV